MPEKTRAYLEHTQIKPTKRLLSKRAPDKTRKVYCAVKISIPPGFSKSRIILPSIHHYFLTFSFYAGAATLPQKGRNTSGATNNPQFLSSL